jgi:hypothetical protein
MTQMLQRVSTALSSKMALLNSRRSIAEAQSVTKLTELAFFFIPLTFAATLFGMQIEPFEQRAPLYLFTILGVLLTAFSYIVRLTIRRRWLRGLMQAGRESIMSYADRNRQPVQRAYIPNSLVLDWLWHTLNR